MHIGLYSPHWPPGEGANGIVSYVAAVRDHFVARGHLVSIVAQRVMHCSDGSCVALADLERRPSLIDRATRRIGRHLDREPGAQTWNGRQLARDLACAHRLRPFDLFEMEESFGWAAHVARALDVPVVTRLHGPLCLKPVGERTPEQVHEDATRIAAEARAVRRAQLLTAPTRAILEETCTRSSCAGRPQAQVIPNPVAIAPGDPQWRFDGCERDHILAVGRFDFWKGADTLLLAFEQLLARRPAVRLTMVGPDYGLQVAPGRTLGFAAWTQEFLSPAARARVDYRGLLRPEEIAPLRRAANLCVVASRWENFPYALLEGMVSGCPLVSTDWPGSPDVLVHGETGLLTRVGDPAAMAHALDTLLADPALAARLGAAGRRRCEERFAVEVVGDQLLDFYRTAPSAAAAAAA